jgi:exosortase
LALSAIVGISDTEALERLTFGMAVGKQSRFSRHAVAATQPSISERQEGKSRKFPLYALLLESPRLNSQGWQRSPGAISYCEQSNCKSNEISVICQVLILGSDNCFLTKLKFRRFESGNGSCIAIVTGMSRMDEDPACYRLMKSAFDLISCKITKQLTFAAQGWAQLCLLGVFLGSLYIPVFTNLVRQWSDDPNYSHGFFVPLFSAWVVWKRRKQLGNLSPAPNWLGLLILSGSMGMLALGVFGAENFLSRASFVFALAGLIIHFRGWNFFRVILFPWAALFLMIPLPVIVFNQIALPLQLLASRIGSSLLSLSGIPVVREGNVIYLPSLSLDVAEACSGLRSLMTLITAAVFYGNFYESKIGRRSLIVLSSIPIAIVANGMRIMACGLIGEYWSPEKAGGFLHTFSGVVIFAISLVLLMLLHATFEMAHHFMQPRRAA